MRTREAGSGNDQSTPPPGRARQLRSQVHCMVDYCQRRPSLFNATADADNADSVGLLMQTAAM